jgi:hypothetical protein
MRNYQKSTDMGSFTRMRSASVTAAVLVSVLFFGISSLSAAADVPRAAAPGGDVFVDPTTAIGALAVTCPQSPFSTGLDYDRPYANGDSNGLNTGNPFSCSTHTGSDWFAFSTTKVRSVQVGTVVEISDPDENPTCWGNYVVVSGLDGIEVGYAHLASISSTIAVGTSVVSGRILGVAGHTTDGTCKVKGTHIHLTMENTWAGFNGSRFNPASFLLNHGVGGW